MRPRTAVTVAAAVLATSASAVIAADPGVASSDGMKEVRHATAR
jgi:hypothetical protein